MKLSKGYEYSKKPAEKKEKEAPIVINTRETSRSQYSINIVPPTETTIIKTVIKRKVEESLQHDDLKQIKLSNPFKDDDEMDDLSAYSNSRENSRSERIDVEKEALSTAVATSFSTNDDSFSTSGNFKGDYLSRKHFTGIKFYKVQILNKHLKIESGIEGKSTEKEYSIRIDSTDALTEARRQIKTYIEQGYESRSHKFTYDFEETELRSFRSFLHSPASPAASRNNSSPRGNSDQNSRSLNVDQLNVDENDYSDTSRHSSFYQDDEEEDTGRDGGRTRSRSRGRSVSASRDDRNKSDDEDDDGTRDAIFASLGESPLGKPLSKNPSSVLLAKKWENQDPKGWYVSEKLDGVRCYWNGRTMWSRNNKQYFPPKFFVKHFPKSPLDGELWIDRSTFQKCVSVVRKHQPIDAEWKTVTFMVFDAPELRMPFKDRYKKMKEVFSKLNSPYLKLHDHYICKNQDELTEDLERVQKLGGEGLMIRDPESFYENRRSGTLLKVKTFDDDEAVIIGHEPGNGKYLGQCGSMRVRNGKGIEFSVGSGMNDAMRARPPKIGLTITYKFQGVSTSGTPRFPTFLRIYKGH